MYIFCILYIHILFPSYIFTYSNGFISFCIHIHIYAYKNTYVYMYVCVCKYVSICNLFIF